MTQIRPNLYAGSRYDAEATSLVGTPITAVLNLTPDVPEDKGTLTSSIKFFRVAMNDDAYDIHKKGDAAVAKLAALINAGETVLVHCRQGRSRTPHIIAEFLALREKRDYFEVYSELMKLNERFLWYSVGQEIVDKFYRGELK